MPANRHLPSIDCGCNCSGAANCYCALGCCGGDPPQTMDRIISGFPAYVMRDALYTLPFTTQLRHIKLEISGLDGLNGTLADHLVMGPLGADDCRLFRKAYSFDVTYTISYNDTAPFPQSCATPLTVVESITVTYGVTDGVFVFGWNFNSDILSVSGTFSTLAGLIFSQLIPVASMSFGGTVNLCNGQSGYSETETWIQENTNVCSPSVGPASGTITTQYEPNYGPPNTIKASGIKYTVSDLPTEFLARVGISTTVFGVSGLEAFNGTYEVDFDDEDLCTGGVYEETIDVDVQEYNISATSPCTSFPVGSPFTGTATLRLAPTNEDFYVWVIRIEHPYLTGVRIDFIELTHEWPSGIHCEGYSDDWTQGDECMSNPDPVITVEAEPLWV